MPRASLIRLLAAANRGRLLRPRLLRRPPGGAGGEPDPGPAFAACERALRPGGVLAAITAGSAVSGGTLTDTAGSVVAAGLVYAQHIVLVRP